MVILINNLTKITDTKYSIGFKYNMPLDPIDGMKKNDNVTPYTKEELEQIGKLVDLPQDLPTKEDNPQILYYNPITNTCFYEYQNAQVTLDQAKTAQINILNQACQNTIINTFQSAAFDGKTMQPYDCQITDQSRINGLVTIAQLRLANLTTEPIKWKNSNEPICIEWSPMQMLELGLDLKRHVERCTDRYEVLKVYINKLTTVEEVQKVTWDTVPT